MASQENDSDNLLLEKELLSPYSYLLQVKGKQMRLKIPLAFNHWLNIPDDKLNEVVDTINMLYVGTLLIDDIQDNTKFRRGIPAAHCVFGLPITINTFLHVLCLVHERAYNLCPEASKIIMEQSLDMVRGQGCDIYWRESFKCPTEEQYQKMVEQKTGAMFMMTVQTIQLFSDNKTNYSKLVSLIGRYFQIRDDYCNLRQQEALEEWPEPEDKETFTDTFCEDITEGKFSLPIIHAMNSSHSEEILNILRKRTDDIKIKKHCLSLLENAGSLQYTRDKLYQLDADIRIEVARHGGNPTLEALLDELLSWR